MRSAILLCLVLIGCATYVPVQPVAVYDGNPCNQSYFDAMACQSAVQMGGWYVGGILYHLSGGYDYNYYVRQERVYVSHGGRVTPYRDAVRSVGSGGKYVPPSQKSVGSAGGYVPPSQKSSGTYVPPAQRSAPASKPAYTPPARSSSSYSPPSRPSSSSSYSSPRRK